MKTMFSILALLGTILCIYPVSAQTSQHTFVHIQDQRPSGQIFTALGRIAPFTVNRVFRQGGGNVVSGVRVEFTWNEKKHSLTLAAPAGEELRVGKYANASLSALRQPLMHVEIDGRECNPTSSTFEVFEIDLVASEITRFAADFQQSCQGSDAPTKGFIRFNAVRGLEHQVVIVPDKSKIKVGGEVTLTITVDNIDHPTVNRELWFGYWHAGSRRWWTLDKRVVDAATPWMRSDSISFGFTQKVGFPGQGIYNIFFALDQKVDGVYSPSAISYVIIDVMGD